MRKRTMEMKVEGYFKSEYDRLVDLLKLNPDWLKPAEAVHNTLQRTLGVAEFAQQFGVEYEYIEHLHSGLREKCYALLENRA